ncbi:MAG: hypothetical protein ACOYMA_15485 [Bacteroidia bacterium]
MSLSNFWVITLLVVFGGIIVTAFHLLPVGIAWLSAKISPSKKFAFYTILIISILFSVSYIVRFLSTTFVYENEFGSLGLFLGLILTCLIIGINSSLSVGASLEMYNEKGTFLGILAVIGTIIFYLGIFLAFCFLTIQICYIDPNKSYTWFSGIWHGLFIIPHWIVSWFSDDIYCKAPNSTTAYSVWWWLTFVSSSLSILGGGGSNRS